MLAWPRGAAAQTPTPAGPIYVVQAGETLTEIAQRFNVTVDALMAANDITNPNLLRQGQRLIIPGLEGVTGILDTEIIGFGESFHSLVRRTQIPIDLLRRLNHVVSPTEFYVGASVIVPKQQDASDLTDRISPSPGQSLLEAAAASGSDPWALAALNNLGGAWDGLPGDVLYTGITDASQQSASGLPPAFLSAQIPSLPLKQGGTAEIIVRPAPGASITGTLVDYPLHFFTNDDGSLVALQGVYVMLEPGLYPLQLDATLADGTRQSYAQMVLVARGDQPSKAIAVPPEDPTLMTSEDQLLRSIVSTPTPIRYWQGRFSLPVGLPYCIKDWFGSPRSLTFNGSPYSYFHAGVDFGVCSTDHPFDIYAAANGKVVWTGTLNVRGNVVIVDDGWGVYTIYAHQKEITSTVGEDVQPGQVIGPIGATGHVTGPHLHFEMWVNGIQVNPLDWLNQTFP
jgi:murein DD-endopeptidase MepM/ murein hydrolase activator NlpD